MVMIVALYIGTQNYLCSVHPRDIAESSRYSEEPSPPGTLEFLMMAQELMSTHHLSFPQTITEAIDVYITMTTILEL